MRGRRGRGQLRCRSLVPEALLQPLLGLLNRERDDGDLAQRLRQAQVCWVEGLGCRLWDVLGPGIHRPRHLRQSTVGREAVVE